jgi:hypothetical protein
MTETSIDNSQTAAIIPLPLSDTGKSTSKYKNLFPDV